MIDHNKLKNLKTKTYHSLTPTQQKIAFTKLYNLIDKYEKQLTNLLKTYAKLHYTALPFFKQHKLDGLQQFKYATDYLDNLDIILQSLHDKDKMKVILNIKDNE